jgi:hypothetical protein
MSTTTAPYWLIIRKEHTLDCYNRFVNDAIEETFNRLGHPVLSLELTAMTLQDLLNVVETYPVHAVFTVNADILALSHGENNIWDALDLPLVICLAESPIYHYHLARDRPKNSIVLFQDAHHLAWYKTVVTERCGINTLYHGMYTPRPEVGIPFQQRQFPLVFTGNHMALSSIKRNLDQFPALLHKVAWQVIDQYLLETTADYSLGFLDALSGYGLHHQELSSYSVQVALMHVDRYIRQYRRRLILNSIQHFPITVMGYGWDESALEPSSNKTIILEGFPDSVEVIANSKMALNVLHNVRLSGHDRICTTIERKTACVTDSNPYLRERFTGGHDILFIDYERLDTLDDQLFEAMADEASLEILAGRAYEKRDCLGTPEAFVSRLLEVTDAFYAQKNRLSELQDVFQPVYR